MKPFESFFAPQLEEYLSYRRSIGYVDKNVRSSLRSFDRYVMAITVEPQQLSALFFLTMRKELKGDHKSANSVLSSARGFFNFLVRQGLYSENPLQDIPPLRENSFIPFVFAPDQIEQLLREIRGRIRLEQRYFFQDLTVYMAVMLMARCGLRISEPLRLLLNHYRQDEKTIYIENTKFAKDRLIPLPDKMAREIDNYLAVRKSLLEEDTNPFLFPGSAQKQLSASRISSFFNQAVKACGLAQQRRIVANITFGAPRPHCLRHSFAINTLKKIKERGQSPQKALPILAAYMGHCKYRYTALYLKVLDAQQRQGLVDFAILNQEDL